MNAFYLEGAHKQVPQPAMRDYLGHTLTTLPDINAYELALGDHGRSGEQFDIWQAVYGPVGEDGYPQPIFNKETGEIDHHVAEYWREHYDLRDILERELANAGTEASGQDSHLRGQRRYLLPERRRLSHGRFSEDARPIRLMTAR